MHGIRGIGVSAGEKCNRSFRGRKGRFKEECNVREVCITVKYSLHLIHLFTGTENKSVHKKKGR